MFLRAYGDLANYVAPNKVLVIYGARRVGKTTLLEHYLTKTYDKFKNDSGDNIRTQELLGSQDFSKILSYAEGYDLIAIDEAQEIPSIGMALKILVDQIPGIKIIATGSSSFELAGQVGEPLTGRKRTLTLFPLSQRELRSKFNLHELKEEIPNLLVYGSYPEISSTHNLKEKERLIAEIANSYLIKDILSFDRIKNSNTILALLRLLAFQIGQEVAVNELATKLGVNTKTIARYLDLLEKSFVIVRLGGYSKNLRKEISKKSKYYFWDCGIRNAIIAQFNTLDLRSDVGQLWENFVVIERIKHLLSKENHCNHYFWRTYDGQEIDYIEERNGLVSAYEIKWSTHKKTKPPKAWLKTYPQNPFKVITPNNVFEFIESE